MRLVDQTGIAGTTTSAPGSWKCAPGNTICLRARENAFISLFSPRLAQFHSNSNLKHRTISTKRLWRANLTGKVMGFVYVCIRAGAARARHASEFKLQGRSYHHQHHHPPSYQKMGISGLIPFLEKATEKTNLSALPRNSRAAIDAYCWLHKGAFACADQLARGEATDV